MERGGELLRMTIYGQAAGAGSKQAHVIRRKGGVIVWTTGPKIIGHNAVIGQPALNYTHDSKKTAPWMRHVEKEARVAWTGLEPLDGALWLDAIFYERRIDGHFFQRKAGRVLRPDAPAYPAVTQTHDIDKMRRAISDSLTNAGVLADDKRIVGGEAWKDYAENIGETEPKVLIRVGTMAAQTVTDLGLVSPDPDGQESLLSG